MVADFEKICLEDSVASSTPQSEDGVDKMSSDEAVPYFNRTFWKIDVHDGVEKLIFWSTHLDLIRATIIDSFVEEQVMEPTSTSTQRNET